MKRLRCECPAETCGAGVFMVRFGRLGLFLFSGGMYTIATVTDSRSLSLCLAAAVALTQPLTASPPAKLHGGKA